MVAKISSPKSILRALNYNEKKVQKGNARCIEAGNFLEQVGELNFYKKLDRFRSLIERNARAQTNTLHISLNFHPSEKFTQEKLREIASAYMVKIGFGQQPFLVYEHHDAAHPHLHIVTTSILEDGKRIDTYNIGRNQSEKARKEIEKEFGLVRAEGREKTRNLQPVPANPQRLRYGYSETKQGISNVLATIVKQYNYTSLAGLNAVLRLYHIEADPGQEGSRMNRNGGLQYRLIDEQGNKMGVPIKASSIYFKPTMQYLEEKFRENEKNRLACKQPLKTSVEWVLRQRPTDLEAFINGLKKEKVSTVLRRNGDGLLYGITFIDHRNRSVFNGSELGKPYSVAGIQSRLGSSDRQQLESKAGTVSKQLITQKSQQLESEISSSDIGKQREDLFQILMNRERFEGRIPYNLVRKKKKKRKAKF